ncbi:MAG: type II secretion system protein GspM [Albidovulum sp.]|uniref:type II secretion system protein GspM n=1 Tax=Albidovulum sp. TaxID=1872424 RepID=UPI003CB84EB4
MTFLTRQFSSALAIALPLFLLLLVWVAIFQPFVTWRGQTAEELASLASSLSDLETRRQNLLEQSRAQQSTDLDDIVWVGSQLGEVNALAQTRIGAMAREHGVSLRSVTPQSNTARDDFPAIGFRIEGEAPLDFLVHFLVSLEFNQPALIVEKATIRRLNRAGSTEGQPAVFVQLDVIAPVNVAGGVTQ